MAGNTNSKVQASCTLHWLLRLLVKLLPKPSHLVTNTPTIPATQQVHHQRSGTFLGVWPRDHHPVAANVAIAAGQGLIGCQQLCRLHCKGVGAWLWHSDPELLLPVTDTYGGQQCI
jgi:hypothetical protein